MATSTKTPSQASDSPAAAAGGSDSRASLRLVRSRNVAVLDRGGTRFRDSLRKSYAARGRLVLRPLRHGRPAG